MATKGIVDQLRHSKETLYGRILMIVGVILWGLFGAVIAVSLAMSPWHALIIILELSAFVAFGAIVAAFYRAHIFGHFVLVGDRQFPTIHAVVRQQAGALGMKEVPRVFVHNANGLINAFALKLVGGPFVLLTSSLVDVDTSEQLHFVIGHELAHHAAGHTSFWRNALKLPGHFVPFLGPAYSRARELTCDRVGAYLIQDLESACGALQMLACGSARLNGLLDRGSFEAQERMVSPLFGFLALIFSRYPRHTTRVLALTSYFEQGRTQMPRGATPQPA